MNINNYLYINNKWIFHTIPQIHYIKDLLTDSVISIQESTLLSYQLAKSNYYQQLDDKLDKIDNNINDSISMDNVKKLVNNYNDIINYTNSKINIPNDLNLIGLDIDLNGNLYINENELIQAINNESESVNNVMNTLIHNLQEVIYDNYDNLFPTLDNIINEKLQNMNLYNENAQTFINTNIGNIIDFYK